MKKMCVSVGIFCLLTVVFCLPPCEQTCSAETLKVIQDQFEFREEPRVADETILGTLRLGTPVEWTGEASGAWLRVKAPNGQIGWVHSSGLSKPTTPIQPTPTPRSQTSRSVSVPSSPDSKQLQAAIRKLEQTNKQYQGTLAEKDRRIAELTKDIEALEARLTDVAQMIEDQEQLSKVDQIKVAELQNEIAALQDAIKKKDEALLTEKVERTKLSNQLNESQLQSENRSSRERFWLYALSLPLNLIALLVIGFWGIRRLRRQKNEDAMFESLMQEREDAETMKNAQTQEVQEEPESLLPSQEATVEKQGVETGLEELDIVMATSPETESAFEPEKSTIPQPPPVDEEVVNDLTDLLPIGQNISLESERPEEEIEIVVAELETEEPETILSGESIEIIAEQQQPESEKILSEEAIVTIEEEPQFEQGDESPGIEEPEHTIEIFSQGIADENVAVEELDQVMIIETDETLTPIDESLDEHVEELLKDTPPMSQDTSLEELLEEGELEEEARSETEESEQVLESEIPEEVEFEMLVERNTQIIELIKEKFEEAQISEIVETAEEAAQHLQEQSPTRNDEPEKFSERLEVEEKTFLEQSPSFLEPTPFLIEPEHEPEESAFTSTDQTESATSAEHAREPRYDIELIDIGKNPGHIIHILSKIEGLTQSPQELVEHVPCTIARGAKEMDAKNFQVVMHKFGSEVRLIKR